MIWRTIVALKDNIEKKYSEILTLAQQYDSCFESEPEKDFGSPTLSVKKEDSRKYWEIRDKLESEIAEWMNLLRKSLDTIPSSEKKCNTDTRYDPMSEETYTVTVYENQNFSSLLGFFNKIKGDVEEDYESILAKIRDKKLVHSKLRNLRGVVLSFSHSLDVFIPEKMVTIEQQVDIIFKLRELGLEKAAEEIEGIDEEQDNRLKCLKARTALEQVIVSYCEKHGVTPTSFYYNLLHAIEKGMTKKEQQKTIAAHYSFVSKIVHKDIEATHKNTQYALHGVLNIIGSLILRK